MRKAKLQKNKRGKSSFDPKRDPFHLYTFVLNCRGSNCRGWIFFLIFIKWRRY